MEEERSPLLEWSAAPHAPYGHSTDWFWTVGFIGLVVVIGAFIAGDWTFSILVVIITATIIMSARNQPQHFSLKITDRAIVAGDRVLPYNSLAAFSLDERHHRPTLVVYKKSGALRHVHLPLALPATFTAVREALATKLNEIPHTYTFTELIGEHMGIV